MSLSRAVLAVVLLCFAGSGSANAHTGGTTGFAAVTVEGQTVRYSLSLGVEAVEGVRRPTLSTDTLHRAFDDDALANIVARHVTVTADGKPCAPVPGVVQSPAPGRSTVSLVVQYACAAPVRALVLTDDLFVALGRDHHTITRVEWSGGHQQVMFDPDRREARIDIGVPDAPAGAAVHGALGFFSLGLEHILTGFDHVLFLLALILGGGSIKSLLGIVTAFTIAHSTTLGLAALDVVRAPERFVEPLIAL